MEQGAHITRRTGKPAYYEYCSQTKIFGLPFIHIKISRHLRMNKPGIAKGIIAIGDIAVGLVALGGISLGVISLGGIALGFLALGGLALGLTALGGVAIGIFAFGGVAIGWSAMGGYAIGEIAIGGIARGTVAVGGQATGDYVISGGLEGPNYSLSQVNTTKNEVRELITTAYPNLSDWIIKILTTPFK